MKISTKAREVINNKIKELEGESSPYFDIDRQESYPLVLLNYFQLAKIMKDYLENNPNEYTLNDNDDIEIENNSDINEYTITYVMKHMEPIYLEVLSSLFTTYDYSAHVPYVINHSLDNLSDETTTEELQEIKNKLIKTLKNKS